MRGNKKIHICICAATNALSHRIELYKDVNNLFIYFIYLQNLYNATISYII